MDSAPLVNITFPVGVNEKFIKELSSSLDNMISDAVKLFKDIKPKHKGTYESDITIAFDTGERFHITYQKKSDKERIVAGMENAYGITNNNLTFEQALIINKYCLEIQNLIKSKRISIEKGEPFSKEKHIEGSYTLPSSKKIPIYGEKTDGLHFKKNEPVFVKPRKKVR